MTGGRLKGGDLLRGGLAVLVLLAVDTAINMLTARADNPDLPAWKPMLWEASSGAVTAFLVWIPWAAVSWAAPDEAVSESWRTRARFGLIHLVAFLAFSSLHVAGFVAVRKTVYALMAAGSYRFGDRFPYELRKDVIGYVLLVAIFWVTAYIRQRRNEVVRPVSFDIRDGARLIRVPVSDILAVCSAGNYVDFRLADSRRPLMRATLAAVEAELERFGFVRTHRSWLVNAARVTGLQPDGSGDWTVTLDDVEAPLSRRFPAALERLRTP